MRGSPQITSLVRALAPFAKPPPPDSAGGPHIIFFRFRRGDWAENNVNPPEADPIPPLLRDTRSGARVLEEAGRRRRGLGRRRWLPAGGGEGHCSRGGTLAESVTVPAVHATCAVRPRRTVITGLVTVSGDAATHCCGALGAGEVKGVYERGGGGGGHQTAALA